MLKYIAIAIIISTLATQSHAAIELVIGEKRVSPGIRFIFEGAIKDHVIPRSIHLAEKQTDIHIEARVNWDTEDVPAGTPKGGFVPYLHITAKVTNQRTGLSTFIDLLPHINLVDNFHYARNITLPGKLSDRYAVVFTAVAPPHLNLAIHKDWIDSYGRLLMRTTVFKYKNIDFEDIAKASRR